MRKSRDIRIRTFKKGIKEESSQSWLAVGGWELRGKTRAEPSVLRFLLGHLLRWLLILLED